MKLAPSKENVELLREVSQGLVNIGEQAIQSASAFAVAADACENSLTEGDAEALGEIVGSLYADAKSLLQVAQELASEVGQLADDLEEQINVKTLKR